ncbi:MAG: hypothetical protein WCL34_13335, partial [Methylococcaceae bacterium]
MGFFSWKTSDTKKVIWNEHSRKGATPSPVYMITKDGRSWKEDSYSGYGDFGGKDYYELVAELNGKEDREDGIDIFFGKTYKKDGLPKLVEHLPSKENWEKEWNKLPNPQSATNQGYFVDGGTVGVKGKEIYWFMPFHAYEKDGTITIYVGDEKISTATNKADASFQINNLHKGYYIGGKWADDSILYHENGVFYVKIGKGITSALIPLGKTKRNAEKKYELMKTGAKFEDKFAKGGKISDYDFGYSVKLKEHTSKNGTLIELKQDPKTKYYAVFINGFGGASTPTDRLEVAQDDYKYELAKYQLAERIHGEGSMAANGKEINESKLTNESGWGGKKDERFFEELTQEDIDAIEAGNAVEYGHWVLYKMGPEDYEITRDGLYMEVFSNLEDMLCRRNQIHYY